MALRGDRNLFSLFDLDSDSDGRSDFELENDGELTSSSSDSGSDSEIEQEETSRSRPRNDRSGDSGSGSGSDVDLPGPSHQSADFSGRGKHETASNDRARNRSKGQPNQNTTPWIEVVEPDVTVDALDFSVIRTGVRNVGNISSPMEFFSLFFSDAVFMHLVRMTNKYARDWLGSWDMIQYLEDQEFSRYQAWPAEGTTVEEIKKYLGLRIAMGILKKNSLADYWTTNKVIRTPYFEEVMPLKQFQLLNRMFHVNDLETEVRRGEKGFDPWAKIRCILDMLNRLFKYYYVPSRNVSIDESLVGIKNRIVCNIENKRHSRFGIKKFDLCDSNGYVLHTALYAGKDFDLRCRQGQAHAVVLELLSAAELLGKGYHLYTDRFYTKPALAEDLISRQTLLTGTVMANSVGLCPKLASARLEVGSVKFMRRGPILSLAFREKKTQRKPVLLLSTAHEAKISTRIIRGKEKTKPDAIFDYNSYTYMGGVDVKDKTRHRFAGERDTHRYWVKIFGNLLDTSLLNAFELYKQHAPGQKLDRKKFILEVVESLCGTFGADTPDKNPDTPETSAKPVHQPEHRLFLIEGRKEMNCIVCSTAQKRRRSRHWCPACGVGIHEQCEPSHTHANNIPRRGRKRKL